MRSELTESAHVTENRQTPNIADTRPQPRRNNGLNGLLPSDRFHKMGNEEFGVVRSNTTSA